MTPIPEFKERHLIWNEEIHTFVPLRPNRFQHRVRKIGEKTPDDRPGKPPLMTGKEVEYWIVEHDAPQLTWNDVAKAKQDMDEKGTFGPMDNPKQGDNA